jgi:zinc protease
MHSLIRLIVLLSIGSWQLASGQTAIPPVKFTDTRLPNGLRVLIAEDHYAPVYAIAVSYSVGSKDERKGRTGFAHLFEHMMFKGSEKVGSGEHFFLVFNYGGSMNGTTNTDRTVYFEILPKNQLDLGLFLEADRMRSLTITAENLENQRQTVKEERRLGLDNQPYGRTYERMNELIFDNFAYHHSVIGSMEDLDAATVNDVKAFFKTYYAPNNAVVALVGDLDTQETLAKIGKYFGEIPRQEAPKPVDLSEPAMTTERRERIEDKLARAARVDISYKLPAGGEADIDRLSVMSTILGGGESSRLYQKLVRDKQICSMVFSRVDERKGPSVLSVGAMVRSGHTPEEAEALIVEEIARLRSEPVSENELRRARSMIRRNAVGMRTSALSRAMLLADDAVLFNDPGRMNTNPEKRTAVTAAQVQEAAKAHLGDNQRIVVYTLPAQGATGPPRGPAPTPPAAR